MGENKNPIQSLYLYSILWSSQCSDNQSDLSHKAQMMSMIKYTLNTICSIGQYDDR